MMRVMDKADRSALRRTSLLKVLQEDLGTAPTVTSATRPFYVQLTWRRLLRSDLVKRPFRVRLSRRNRPVESRASIVRRDFRQGGKFDFGQHLLQIELGVNTG